MRWVWHLLETMANPTKSASGADELSPCATLLRRGDRDRFLICQFADSAVREDLFALFAFNLEIAKTRETVSEPMLGRIRLQWWRDTLDGIERSEVRRHEVIEPLAVAITRHGLPRHLLERLIDARELDLEPGPPESLTEFEAYCLESSALLIELAMIILGGPRDAAITRSVGIAHAIAGLLTALPRRVGEGRLDIPADLLPNVTAEEIRQRGGADGLVGAIEALGRHAKRLLAEASPGAVAGRYRAPLLVGVAARRMLRRLERVGWNPFDPRLAAPTASMVPRLVWSRVTGRW